MSVLRSHYNKTRGGLGRVCATGMYRSIETWSFRNFKLEFLLNEKRPWSTSKKGRFFETSPVGPNWSIEFWTEISGNFGWMDRATRSLVGTSCMGIVACTAGQSNADSGNGIGVGAERVSKNSRICVCAKLKLVYPVWNLSDSCKSQDDPHVFSFPNRLGKIEATLLAG